MNDGGFNMPYISIYTTENKLKDTTKCSIISIFLQETFRYVVWIQID